jgi:hypothetical protein
VLSPDLPSPTRASGRLGVALGGDAPRAPMASPAPGSAPTPGLRGAAQRR